MKKIYSIIVVTFVIILGWSRVSTIQSAGNEPVTCEASIDQQIYAMRQDWNKNLEALMAQEKPSSQKVNEAFESLRTYRCWLNYLCEAVSFSGNADAKALGNGRLNRTHIDTIAGCVEPGKVEIPSTHLQFMPQCQAGNVNDKLSVIQKNYTACRAKIELEFASTDHDPKATANGKKARLESSAFVALERALKKDSANQSGRIIGDKLREILTKMHGMESHITLLREYLEKFDSQIPCVIDKCL